MLLSILGSGSKTPHLLKRLHEQALRKCNKGIKGLGKGRGRGQVSTWGRGR